MAPRAICHCLITPYLKIKNKKDLGIQLSVKELYPSTPSTTKERKKGEGKEGPTHEGLFCPLHIEYYSGWHGVTPSKHLLCDHHIYIKA